MTHEPPQGLLISRTPVRSKQIQNFGGIEPRAVTAILREKKRGIFRRWAPFCVHMQSDAYVQEAYSVRRMAVSGRKWKVSPGTSKRRDAGASLAASELVGEMLTRQAAFEDTLYRALDGIGTGIAVHEIEWLYEDGVWWPSFIPVDTEDLEFAEGGGLLIRPMAQASNRNVINVADHPGKFWMHLPTTRGGGPSDQGKFVPISWPYMLKNFGSKFWTAGAERFAMPFIMGTVAPDAPQSVRDKLLSDLREMMSESVGVSASGSGLTFYESKAPSTSAMWKDYCDVQNTEIFVGFSVPPDLIVAGDVGARAAVSERRGLLTEASQMDATSLWGSFTRDVIKSFLDFNAHLLGSARFDMPIVESVFEQRREAAAMSAAVTAGTKIRQSEYRSTLGLDPLGSALDDEFVKPEVAGVASALAPLPAASPDVLDVPAAATSDVQKTALNGAQVASMLEVVNSVVAGTLPRASAVAVLVTAFPISREEAEAIIGTAGAGFVPAMPPDSEPAAESTASGGTPAALPFSSPSSSAPKTTTAKSGATPSRSMTPLDRVLAWSSDDPPR